MTRRVFSFSSIYARYVNVIVVRFAFNVSRLASTRLTASRIQEEYSTPDVYVIL